MVLEQDRDKFALMEKELFSCVLGDVLDAQGLTHQFLPRTIGPLAPDMKVVGRAKTVLEADCTGSHLHVEDRDFAFGLMFDALDSLRPGEVYLCTGASPTYACWGELMSQAARQRGAAGAVVEGCSRDTRAILDLTFPTFSLGSYGQDQGLRGRVIDYDCPIEFSNQVLVHPGDIVFGDIDGVVIIPRDIEESIIEAAQDKVKGENKIRKLIQEGIPTRQIWDQYGIM